MPTLKSMTKAQLIAHAQDQAAQLHAARHRISELEGTIALLPSPKPATTARLRYLADQQQRQATGPSAFQLRAQQARDLAMATGKAVKV